MLRNLKWNSRANMTLHVSSSCLNPLSDSLAEKFTIYVLIDYWDSCFKMSLKLLSALLAHSSCNSMFVDFSLDFVKKKISKTIWKLTSLERLIKLAIIGSLLVKWFMQVRGEQTKSTSVKYSNEYKWGEHLSYSGSKVHNLTELGMKAQK